MGLDIYHYKLSSSKLDNYIFCREIDSDMKSKYGFDKYKNKAIVNGFFSLVAVFETESDLNKTRPSLELLRDANSDYKFFCYGSLDDSLNAIIQFEHSFAIDASKRNINKTSIDIGNDEISYIDIFYDCSIEQDIYYVEECGYQRKGMGSGFFKYFENDCYFADQNSFDKLLEFCDPANHMYNPENVKETFVNKYESGKSILLISW